MIGIRDQIGITGQGDAVMNGTTRKELGKITAASFGYGGYDDAMFGATFSLGGDAWSVGDFHGSWHYGIASTDRGWTEETRTNVMVEAVKFLYALMRDAKKRHVAELVGTPIEVTFDGNRLVSWRVLTEVL